MLDNISGPTIYKSKTKLPIISIANYGPHASLDETILGFKQEMTAHGYKENQNIRYEIADVGFEPSLIPQMLESLKAKHPKLMLVMTTPVAQAAKAKIKDIPLIYTVVTNPLEAGLIKKLHHADANMTGSSDRQNLKTLLQFVQIILPKAKRIGLLYSSSEINDMSLVRMMKKSASQFHMSVMAIPVDKSTDVMVRMQEFKNHVDFIYVGSSGPIQPSLPIIASQARRMQIPVFNVEKQAVKDGLALASYGVDYATVGKYAAKLACLILKGKKVSQLSPLYPSALDHKALVNSKLAREMGIHIPLHVSKVG